jgi:glucose-1-phosphate cytidylyltransferase
MMKVVILAGGLGTRLSEETDFRPKPMVEIGGKPILWHIMKIYSSYGFNDFIVCLGYKGYYIKDYFHHYNMHQADLTIDLKNNTMEYHISKSEPWRLTLVDTGLNTMTGGRLKRIRPYVGDETFMMTYGDGVADINIAKLVAFHRSGRKLATLTAVQPRGRFGAMELNHEDGTVRSFQEKPEGEGAWINGGFFVLEPAALDYVAEGDQSIWERKPLERLAAECQLQAYRHRGFWRPMDTLRDRRELEELWESGAAPWRTWKDN